MTKTKIGFVLAFLVLGVFLMRNSDISVGTAAKQTLRRALFAVVGGVPTYQSSAGTNICSGLNIDTPFSEAEISQAQSVKASVQSMRGGNPLRVALEGGSIGVDYVTGLIPLIAPWAALFVISAFICLSLCCSWCCMHGCCKNTKCCSCCKQPQIFKKKWVYVGITVLMLLGTFSAGIAGAVFSGKVPTGMQLTLCSFIGMVEDFIYGKTDAHFLGLSGVQTSLDTIISQFNTVVNNLGAITHPDTTLDTNYNTALTSIDNLYNNNKNYKAQRGAGDQTLTPPTEYTPDYISNLGPKATASTFTNLIYTEVNTQYKIVDDALSTVGPAIDTLKGQQTTILDGIKLGKSAVADVQKTINSLLDSLGNYGSTIKDVFSAIGSALVAIFVVFIVVAVLVIVSILVILMKKVKFLNKFLHFSWCVMGLLTLLTWLVSVIFYPVSVVLMEACDVIEVVLTDDTSRKNIFSGLTSGTTVDMFTQCLSTTATDPDFASPFGLTNNLKDFRSIFTQLDTIEAKFGLNAAPVSVTIPPQTSAVQDILDGKTPDSTVIADDLIALNKATNKDTANPTSCTTVIDKWVLGSTTCVAADGTKFLSTNAAGDNVNSATCIGFDQWNGKTINTRYSGKFTACSNLGSPAATAETYVTKSVDNFVKHRTDINTAFNSIKTDLGTVQTNYNTFANRILNTLTNFKTMKNDLTAITDSLDGATNGILSNLKCGFIRTDLLRISNSMCSGFVVNLYQTSVALIVTSFFTLFSTIAVFLLTKRILLSEYMAAKTSPSGLSPPVNQFSPY